MGETRQLPATLCIIMLLLSFPFNADEKGRFWHNSSDPTDFIYMQTSTLYFARGVIDYIRFKECYQDEFSWKKYFIVEFYAMLMRNFISWKILGGVSEKIYILAR